MVEKAGISRVNITARHDLYTLLNVDIIVYKLWISFMDIYLHLSGVYGKYIWCPFINNKYETCICPPLTFILRQRESTFNIERTEERNKRIDILLLHQQQLWKKSPEKKGANCMAQLYYLSVPLLFFIQQLW